jgi:hypothetical protein
MEHRAKLEGKKRDRVKGVTSARRDASIERACNLRVLGDVA